MSRHVRPPKFQNDGFFSTKGFPPKKHYQSLLRFYHMPYYIDWFFTTHMNVPNLLIYFYEPSKYINRFFKVFV